MIKKLILLIPLTLLLSDHLGFIPQWNITTMKKSLSNRNLTSDRIETISSFINETAKRINTKIEQERKFGIVTPETQNQGPLTQLIENYIIIIQCYEL